MYNNIEISEINSKKVVRSVWLLFQCLLVGVGIVICTTEGLGAGLYYVITSLVWGSPFWIGAIAILILIEYFVLNERATDKTVKKLFAGETMAIVLIASVGCIQGNWETALLVPLFFSSGQILRWFYLKSKGRMYHKITRKKTTFLIHPHPNDCNK